MTLTPEQFKAARQLLGWSRTRLASRVGVSERAVLAFESPAKLSNARIAPGQVKAARQLLGWWQSDLAKLVRVSEKSIRDFESGESFATSLDLGLVCEVLESAGIEFIAIGSAPAVKLQEVGAMADRSKARLDPIDQARLRAEVRIKVDAWISAQPKPRPSRPEAIRRLLAEALAEEADGLSQRQADPQPTGDGPTRPEIPPNDTGPYDGSPM